MREIHMRTVISYALAFIVAGSTAAFGSMIWPKVTSRPRPQPLTYVYEHVKDTSLGKQFSQTLGIDELTKPIDLSVTAASVAGAVVDSVEEQAKNMVASQIGTQLIKQFQGLPDKEKLRVQENICKQ